MTLAIIGLGANLGDPRATLISAVTRLSATAGVSLQGVSGLWRTAPVGGPQQPEYLNAVVILDTALAAGELLDICRAEEAAAERVRGVRWGPRTLDLDILDIEGVTSADPQLLIPHPRAHERAFVLAPWAQLTPQWPLRAAGRVRSVEQWRSDVADQAVALLDAGPWWR